MIVVPNAIRREILAAQIAAGPPAGLLNGAICKLIATEVDPTPNMTLAQLDELEATFDGYAPSTAIAWGTPFTNSLNQAVTVGSTKQFNCTGPTVGEVISAYYVTNAAGDKLLFSEKLPVAVPVVDVGNAVIIIPTYSQGQ